MDLYEIICKLNWIWAEIQKIELLINEKCNCDSVLCCDEIKENLHDCCESLQNQISELSNQVETGNQTINSTLALILSNQQTMQNHITECCESLSQSDTIIINKIDEVLSTIEDCCDGCEIDLGEWDSHKRYPKTKDGCRVLVSYEGEKYQALKQSKGKVPPDSPNFWLLIP